MRSNPYQTARLLIVEPSYYLAQVMRSQLTDVGFRRVDVVKDTATALENLDSARYAAVLCDADTGTLDPLEFAKIARRGRMRTGPFFCLLMLSQWPTLQKVGACRDVGANGFLMKPVSAKQLRTKILASLSAPRKFVDGGEYFGPDRRRGMRGGNLGLDRRSGEAGVAETIIAPRLTAA